MQDNLLSAIEYLEASSAQLLQAVSDNADEPLVGISVIPIIEVIGSIAARLRIIHGAVQYKQIPHCLTNENKH